jgi:hypothetical protein
MMMKQKRIKMYNEK